MVIIVYRKLSFSFQECNGVAPILFHSELFYSNTVLRRKNCERGFDKRESL